MPYRHTPPLNLHHPSPRADVHAAEHARSARLSTIAYGVIVLIVMAAAVLGRPAPGGLPGAHVSGKLEVAAR